MRVEFHPEATAELEASIAWYAERDQQAAERFLVAIERTINSITLDPERFAVVDERYRSCSVTRFPFQIVFCHDDESVTILAIAHAKRRPEYWQERSSD